MMFLIETLMEEIETIVAKKFLLQNHDEPILW